MSIVSPGASPIQWLVTRAMPPAPPPAISNGAMKVRKPKMSITAPTVSNTNSATPLMTWAFDGLLTWICGLSERAIGGSE